MCAASALVVLGVAVKPADAAPPPAGPPPVLLGDLTIYRAGGCIWYRDSVDGLWIAPTLAAGWNLPGAFPSNAFRMTSNYGKQTAGGPVTETTPFPWAIGGEPTSGNAFLGHTVITDFWSESVQPVGGAATASAPASRDFWAASDSGAGPRTLTWDPTGGSWSVVVMNDNGQPGVDVSADLGATLPPLVWISVGFLLFGLVLLSGGVLLVVGAIRRTRTA